jgi:hypothetical protein
VAAAVVAAPSANGHDGAEDKGSAVEAHCDPSEADDETGVDALESGVDDDEEEDDDDDVSASLEDAENVRREILDPSKNLKLRKGFRMASICWDD